MTTTALLIVTLCLQAVTGFNIAQVPVRAVSSQTVQRPSRAIFMQEAPEEKTAAPVDFTPTIATPESAAPKIDDSFDLSKYSMTITIGVLFIGVKALSALGVLDFSS
mmetsp:Transcript_66396/g.148243  ORF Transcript_66396/g.148243 Transcript_66396/m.148243 type:complete len:107 (-) Transcript_66396:560-880(-)